MTVTQRTWSAFGVIFVTGGLLVGCTGNAPETTTDADRAGSGGSGSNSLSCNWDAPALTAETAVDPAVQEGALNEILVGDWQRTGFDIGAGYQVYASDSDDGERDYRFVFSSDGEYVYCQTTPTVDRGESRGDFTLEEAAIDLGDNGQFTALSWNADTMTWRSNSSGATIYLQRR